MRGMKNFVRALRSAWPYRGRLLLSVICAGMAAVFWGLNISAIGPVLKLLGEKQNLQQWADANIQETQCEIDQWEAKRATLVQREKDLHAQAPSVVRSRELTQLVSEIARLDRRQWQADWRLYFYQATERFLLKYAPTDTFRTLAWVVGLVVVAVA